MRIEEKRVNGYRWIVEYRDGKGHVYLGGKKEFEFHTPIHNIEFFVLIPKRYREYVPDDIEAPF